MKYGKWLATKDLGDKFVEGTVYQEVRLPSVERLFPEDICLIDERGRYHVVGPADPNVLGEENWLIYFKEEK